MSLLFAILFSISAWPDTFSENWRYHIDTSLSHSSSERVCEDVSHSSRTAAIAARSRVLA